MRLHRLDIVFAGLLAATGVTWGLGESPLLRVHAGWASGTVLILSLVKGLGIALDFMELRDAPPPWRRFVVGWLLVVIAFVAAVRAVAG